MKKRIVVIGEYFPPRLGGGRRLFEIMKRLSYKYDIHFVTVPPSYVAFIRKIDFFVTEDNQVSYEGMIGHKIGLPRLILRLWTRRILIPYALTMMYLFFRVIEKLIQLKPYVVVIDAPSPYSGFLGVVCSRVLNKKLLTEYNDLQAFYALDVLENKKSLIVRNLLVSIEDFNIKSGWKVTATTNFIKDYAVNRDLRKDITVIPDGVDSKVFHPKIDGRNIRKKFGIEKEMKLCIYSGRIEKSVGAEIILQTSKLLEKRKDIKFMIVGEGNLQIINKLSKCKNVVMTGLIPKGNVPEYLAAADIVLVPLSNTIASHSFSPLKLFEALAMGKPVIASAVSGVKEVITHNFDGILVSNNPEDWASAIIYLIENSRKASFVGRNGRETAKKYDWNQLAKKFDCVIENESID